MNPLDILDLQEVVQLLHQIDQGFNKLASKVDTMGSEVSELKKEQKAVVSEVSQIGKQQNAVFFGDNLSRIQRLRGKKKREGFMKQVEELRVSAQSAESERREIKNQIQQGFQQSEECCVRQEAQLKQMDKRFIQAVEPLGKVANSASRMVAIGPNLPSILFFVCTMLFLGFGAGFVVVRTTMLVGRGIFGGPWPTSSNKGGDKKQDLNEAEASVEFNLQSVSRKKYNTFRELVASYCNCLVRFCKAIVNL